MGIQKKQEKFYESQKKIFILTIGYTFFTGRMY